MNMHKICQTRGLRINGYSKKCVRIVAGQVPIVGASGRVMGILRRQDKIYEFAKRIQGCLRNRILSSARFQFLFWCCKQAGFYEVIVESRHWTSLGAIAWCICAT